MLATLAAAVFALATRGAVPGPALRSAAAVETPIQEGLLAALSEALSQIGPLQAQVDAGNVVPKFGEKAQEIVGQALARAGSEVALEDVERVVDGALEPLFLRQASLVRQKVAAAFATLDQKQFDTVQQAEAQFLTEAEGLVRPGSSWSLALEVDVLRAGLEGDFLRQAALQEERAQAALIQRTTIDVIGRLQDQMEQLQQKVQGARGGGSSPWVLSSSYRIPKTPLQIVGRYESGRANIELNLTPSKDSSHSEESFAEGIGPANLGVSFNLGL